MNSRYHFILFVSCFLFITFNAQSLMVNIPLEELTANAEVIVQGKVRKIWSDWNADKTLIHTYVVVELSDLLKGPGQSNQITFRYIGGEVDGIGLAESDTPRLELDEEVILFLAKNKEKYFRLTGNFQGKFRVERDKLTQKKIVTQTGVSVVKKINGRIILDDRVRGRVFLPRFKKMVKEIVREQLKKK